MEWVAKIDDEGKSYKRAIGASGIEYVVRDLGGAWSMERISAGGEQLSLAQHRTFSAARESAEREEERTQAERFTSAKERGVNVCTMRISATLYSIWRGNVLVSHVERLGPGRWQYQPYIFGDGPEYEATMLETRGPKFRLRRDALDRARYVASA